MKAPAHPGPIVKDQLDDLGVSGAEAARRLGIARPGWNRVTQGRRPITPRTAVLIEQQFGISAEMLVTAQALHDLSGARRAAR